MNASDFEILNDLLNFLGLSENNIKICGSIALQLQGLLPHREPHDIDLVVCINREKLKEYDDVLTFFHKLNKENTHENHYPGDYPYMFYYKNKLVNIWLTLQDDKVFSPIKFNKFYIEPASKIIKIKKKYNRKKDLNDLNEIAKILIN